LAAAMKAKPIPVFPLVGSTRILCLCKVRKEIYFSDIYPCLAIKLEEGGKGS
jgi:hypothetical protein